VRIVTPGTLTDAAFLEDKETNRIAAVNADKKHIAIAWASLQSGEFKTKLTTADKLADELARLQAAEILLPEGKSLPNGFQTTSANITRLNSWQFAADAGAKLLTEYFGCQDLHGFGLDGKEHEAAVGAAGALLNYIRLTQNLMPQHLDGISLETDSQYIGMDAATRRNLEITQTLSGKKSPTLFPTPDPAPPRGAGRAFPIAPVALLRLPGVLDSESSRTTEVSKEEWDVVRATTRQAVEELQAFRLQEGKMLHEVCASRIAKISSLLEEITFPEAERIAAIRQRLEEGLAKIAPQGGYDNSRLEQEMIYYIEKLDINEEKSRLAHHLSYFIEVLNADQPGQGKTLGFIAQEIGREINTMGSKSNQAEMQQLVVKMKDELEQIKEQVLNIL